MNHSTDHAMKALFPVPCPERIDTLLRVTMALDASHCCSVGLAPNASFANKAGPPSRQRITASLRASASSLDRSKDGRQSMFVFDFPCVFNCGKVRDSLL